MRKTLIMAGLLLLCSSLSGCILVVESSGRASYHDSDFYDASEIWFNDVAVYCEYSVGDQISRWTLVANPDTSHGHSEIEDVYASIEGSYVYSYNSIFNLVPVEPGEWRVSIDNIGTPENSYHCANSYDFIFTAYNYGGYGVSEWVVW